MDEMTVLDNIPFAIDIERLLKKLRLHGRMEYEARATQLAREAERIAQLRAMFGLVYIESRDETGVVVSGVRLDSRVLSVNLEGVHRVFPFVVTCGRELQAWADGISDMLEQFWADNIMELAVHDAFHAARQAIRQRFGLDKTAIMNPGSLADWPLEQQRQLFAILGDTAGPVGVQLNDSCLMVPIKSVSGLCYPTEVSFENCQLCPRDPCPGRRAAYDPGLYKRRYAPEQK